MKRDQVHQFSWTSGDRQYDGVGVRVENTVAVAFSEVRTGKAVVCFTKYQRMDRLTGSPVTRA
jgi:hypothetical protein